MAIVSGMKSGASIVLAIIVRPHLWSIAVIQLFRLVPRSWWRQAPYLPIPTQAYLRFRKQTQYGGINHPLQVRDVLSYLNWLRDLR
jgi:hypothetical protein